MSWENILKRNDLEDKIGSSSNYENLPELKQLVTGTSKGGFLMYILRDEGEDAYSLTDGDIYGQSGLISPELSKWDVALSIAKELIEKYDLIEYDKTQHQRLGNIKGGRLRAGRHGIDHSLMVVLETIDNYANKMDNEDMKTQMKRIGSFAPSSMLGR
tara:strand:- start:207 stop:680 length:474 start_codon:yes stop_codon:yes gene_type:complete